MSYSEAVAKKRLLSCTVHMTPNDVRITIIFSTESKICQAANLSRPTFVVPGRDQEQQEYEKVERGCASLLSARDFCGLRGLLWLKATRFRDLIFVWVCNDSVLDRNSLREA